MPFIFSDIDYLQAFMRLLPSGRIWNKNLDSNMANSLAPLVRTFSRLSDRASNLLVDSFPGTTNELLPEWEASLGLPDPCLGENPTVQARRDEVVARFKGLGGQSIPFFTEYAKQLGYDVTIKEFSPFYADRGYSDGPLYDEQGAYLWEVVAPQELVNYFSADVSTAGEPLASFVSDVLECELSRLKPAHTTLFFSFTNTPITFNAVAQFPRFTAKAIGSDAPITVVAQFPSFVAKANLVNYNPMRALASWVFTAKATGNVANGINALITFPSFTARATGTSGTNVVIREPWLQPFNSSSPWNVPVGSNATWSLTTDADTAALRSLRMASDEGITVSVGQASDPLVIFTSTGTNQRDQKLSASIHVPYGTSFGNGRVVLFDTKFPTSIWYFEGCKITDASGNVLTRITTNCTVTATSGETDTTCGDGVDANTLNWGLDAGAGIVRAWEWSNGLVDHALRLSLPANLLTPRGTVPWPLYKQPSLSPTGKVFYGSTIGIPSTVDVTTLGLSPGGLILARALQNHGAIMREVHSRTDIGATIYGEAALANDPLWIQAKADLANILFNYLSIMRNQASSSVNGGGVPIVSAPPLLDPSICSSGPTTVPNTPQGLTVD